MNFKRALPWYLLAMVVIILDQLTKAWVVAELELYQSIELTSFFSFTRAHNTGAAFSIFTGQAQYLALLSGAVSIALMIWLSKLTRAERLLSISLALVLGGALGNLYDRIVLGHVVDFLDFHWRGSHFPAFNIADSAITIGAVLLIWEALFVKKQDEVTDE